MMYIYPADRIHYNPKFQVQRTTFEIQEENDAYRQRSDHTATSRQLSPSAHCDPMASLHPRDGGPHEGNIPTLGKRVCGARELRACAGNVCAEQRSVG